MAKRKTNVIETFKETAPREGIDVKVERKAGAVVDRALLQIDRELIAGMVCGPGANLIDIFLRGSDGQHAAVATVAGEDVGEGRRNHNPEAEVFDCPWSVLTRGTAAEVLPGHKNRCSLVAGLIEHELGPRLAIAVEAPIEEQKRTEAGALNAFQKLLRDNLVGIHVWPQ